jgi:hypothetical protein
MKTIILMLSLLLFGCEPFDPRNNLGNYRCSDEQVEKMPKELKLCEATSYTSSHCFKITKMSTCKYVAPKKTKKRK